MTESQLKAYEEPLVVSELNGEVVLTGPGAIAAALTPAAAEETARRMLTAAGQALEKQAAAGGDNAGAGNQASQLSE
ncbi:MAG: hypothetical protein K2X62_04325 [Beijerinckiaceae bacterium]|nr:hypothetical protein [Beijerinckiaceae bacterium]MDO9440654.1 hypothetical protein [Beijerinckiaceae bacterium]